MTTSHADQPLGLRERKKARTRTAIQDAALRLYLEHGYEATTIEQIAEAAEVSPSTFFRYFPTKPETVLYDRYDPILLESFVHQPAELTPLAAIRAAMRDVLDHLDPADLELEQTRWKLVARVPELRAAVTERMIPMAGMLADAVAKRVGREPDDFAIRTWTGAVIGALYASFLTALDDPDGDFLTAIDAGITLLEDGLPL
jgi:AcrR family transcriptional regulator